MDLRDAGRDVSDPAGQLGGALANARTEGSEANAAASAARLAALRYQLNPHFLFNTLNAVSAAVITQRTDKAETMLSKLAELLGVTLVAAPRP